MKHVRVCIGRFCSIRLLIFLFAAVAAAASAESASGSGIKFADETLHYIIAYKWGLIHKETGTATLTLRNSGSNYRISLTARTKPWADKIFSVRDTLTAVMNRTKMQPLHYTKISHEGGKYSRDDIAYSYVAGQTYGKTSALRINKKGKAVTTKKLLSASESAFDMLTIFYYLRSLDYANMQKGKTFRSVIFSGKKKEVLTIRSLGIQTISTRSKKNVPAYHIRFNFTSENGRKSSDDMDTWISTDPTRIPLRLEGNLPVGKVKCYLAD